jgi:hypothetical protein
MEKGQAENRRQEGGNAQSDHPNTSRSTSKMKVDRSDPLSFFLSVLRNPATPFEEARAAAKEALPYCSPRLASIEARPGGPSHEDRLEELRRLLDDD